MKKTKKALLAALACSVALTGAVGLAACSDGNGGHSHTWQSEWSYNANNLGMGHFHKCTDSTCNEVNGTADHDWGSWTNDAENPGHDKRTCPTCGATETRETPVPHSHSWGEWTVSDENQPTKTAPGKATRDCWGNGECDATAAENEFELPNLDNEGYTTEEVSEPDCTIDGKIKYTYYIAGKDTVEDTTDDVIVEFLVDIPADESLHTWDTEWTKGEEGHWHSCNVGTHSQDFAAHNMTGDHGECKVCGYFAPITIAFPAEGTTVTVPVAYLDIEANARKIEITGLTKDHEYTLSCEGVYFSQSINNFGADSIDLLYTPNEPGDAMTLGCYANGDTALENITLTLTDKGEKEYFEGETLTLDTVSNFKAGTEDSIYFKFEVATAGKYHFEWGGGVAAADVLIGVYTGFGVSGASDQIGDNTDGSETFDLDAGTYYIGILSNKEEPAGSWNYVSVSGTVTLKAGAAAAGGGGEEEPEPEPEGPVLTPEGGSVPISGGDGTVITLTGFTVGHKYSVTMTNGNQIGAMIMNGVSEFTYEDGMTITAKYLMGAGPVNGKFSFKEIIESGATIGLNTSVTVTGATTSAPNTYNIELAAGNYSVLKAGDAVNLGAASGITIADSTGAAVASQNMVFNIATAGTYTISVSANTTFKVLSVGTLTASENTVTISVANDSTYSDMYVFAPATDAETQYSMTVPEGVHVLLNNVNFITSGTVKNFTVGAGEKILFAFFHNATGDITVTIGEPAPEAPLPQITPDTPMTAENNNAVSVGGREVLALQVGDGVTEGTYRLKITPSRDLSRSEIFFGLKGANSWYEFIGADSSGNYNPAEEGYNPKAEIRINASTAEKYGDGENYVVTPGSNVGEATVIELTLKAGDKLYFAASGASGSLEIELEAVTATTPEA